MLTSRSLAFAALLFGLTVVALSGVFISMKLRSVEPLNGAYGDQAILAFELAKTPQDLATVIGPNPPTAAAVTVRAQMDLANKVDFLYMTAYGLFIATSCALAARLRGRRWLLLGAALGPLAALFDVAENLALLQITTPGADWAALLPSLHLRTLAKWELLAATTALFAAGFVGERRIVARVVAPALVLVAIGTGVMTLVNPAKYLVLLSTAIVVAWIWQLGYAATVAVRR